MSIASDQHFKEGHDFYDFSMADCSDTSTDTALASNKNTLVVTA